MDSCKAISTICYSVLYLDTIMIFIDYLLTYYYICIILNIYKHIETEMKLKAWFYIYLNSSTFKELNIYKILRNFSSRKKYRTTKLST